MGLRHVDSTVLSALLCCLAAVSTAQVLPTLTEIMQQVPDQLPGTYQVTSNCNAVVTLSDDECEVSITADPEDCLTPQVILGKLLGSSSDSLTEILSTIPKVVTIEKLGVDICGETMTLAVASTTKFDIVPNVVSVDGVLVEVTMLIPTKSVKFLMKATWYVGDVSFTIEATNQDDKIVLVGTPNPASKEFNMAEMVSAVTKKFGGDVSGAVKQVGLDSVRLKDVVLTAGFSDRGYAFRFAFQGISSTFGNPNLMITINRLTAESSMGITIGGGFTNLNMATVFDKLTGIDVSNVPFIGKAVFTDLAMILSTIELGEPILPYDHEGMQKLTPIHAGVQLNAAIQLKPGSNATNVKIILSKKKVLFKLLGESVSVSAFIDKLVSNLGPLSLPPKFSLQSFLDLHVTSFEYDADTKIFTIPVILPNPVIFVPRSIEMHNATIIFDIRTGGGSGVGVDMTSVWHLGKYEIPLSISKPIGMPVFVAESNPQFDIPFGEMIKQFAVALLPSGGLENAVKKIGLESFYIKDPNVKIILSQDKVLRVKGTTVIGNWDKCNAEILLGQVSGSFVMATGLEILDVPITKLIYEMTDKKVNIGLLPGASILDSTDAAITMSSQNVPKVQEYMQFSLQSLSSTAIVDGVTVVAAFKFPKQCKDQGCQVAKRLIGADAQLVLKGRLYVASVELTATVPTEIQVFRGVNITDVGLEVEVGTRSAIGITGTLKLKDPDLTFIGSFGMSTSGAYLQMAMAGMWRKPFGIPVLAIGDLLLRASIIPDPALLSAVEFGGKAEIGLFDNPKAVPIKAAMYIGVDRVSVMENFFYGSITSLTIPDVLKAFATSVNLPKPLAEIGFPKGVNVSYALKTKVFENGVIINRGFLLQGIIKVLFFEAHCNIKLNLNGIFVDLWVKPFNIGKGLVAISGRSNTQGPRIYVDIGWNPPRAFINIEGTIKVLGISASTNLTVDHKGMSFSVTGKMLNLFEAGLTITSSYDSLQTADFMVAGYFRQSLMERLEREVQSALQAYKQRADRAISDAQRKVNSAKGAFITASNKIKPLEDKVRGEKSKFDAANRKLQNSKRDLDNAKKEWDKAVGAFNKAQSAVNDQQRKFNSAADSLNRAMRHCNSLGCRKRRSIDNDLEEGSFLRAPQAKSVLKKRVKRWGIRIRIKNPIELAREGAEKVNEAVRFKERAREVKCAGQAAAKATCIAGLKTAQFTVRALAKSLDAAKFTLKGAKELVDKSRHIMEVAKAGVTVAQGAVTVAKHSLDVAAGALTAARVVVSQARHTLVVAEGALEAVKYANRFGVEVGKQIAKWTLGGILDIQEMTFSVRLSVAQTGHFRGSLKAKILGKTQRFSFDIKLLSVKDMVNSLVNKVKSLMGLRRRKRSISVLPQDVFLERMKLTGLPKMK